MKKNIAVIFGGESTEHDISILTGIQVANALEKQKYNVLPIYISNDGKWYIGKQLLKVDFYNNYCKKRLKQVAILPNSSYLYIKKFGKYKKYTKIDCTILALHGKNGEDGTIQGLLELAKIPYSSGDVFASSVGLNKQKMKELFVANKIPICKYAAITKKQFDSKNFDFTKIQFPAIVKPNCLGSSIGISVCKNIDELNDAINLAFCFDQTVLIEKCIENLKEVNISVLGNGEDCICSVTEQPISNGLLSFEKKYLTNKTKQQNSSKTVQNYGSKNGMQNADRVIPADITKSQQKTIENLAKKIFAITNSKGVVRIDFMIDTKTNKIYANEINTIPGSFAFYLWQKSNLQFDKLLDMVIDIAIRDKIQRQRLTTKFNSTVLSQNAKISK